MNIVSIDFDIIMAPSIELYNSFENKPLYENYYINMFNADFVIYNKLTNWLLKIMPSIKPEDIIFIESHEQIINFIPNNDVNSIVNIDHHHDLGYAPPEELDKSNLPLNCGNWGLHLLRNGFINNYTWIKNENSRKCFYNKYNFNTKAFYDFDLNSLKADRIVICLSSPWVPAQYNSLFNLWIDMAGIIHNTQYYLIENK